MNRRVLCAMVALAPTTAHGDGIAVVGGSPRAIGRAGAAAVGDDGGGALLVNPAVMARRDAARVQLGVAVIDDSTSWQSDTPAAPLSKDQAASRLAPLGAAIGALGNSILGAGVMTAGVSDRALPRPSDLPAGQSSYDYRYAGIAGLYRRDTLVLGAARRLSDSVALGLSLSASQVRVAEHRRIWAGFGGRDPIGASNQDVDLSLTATDRFTPGAAAGVLYAPGDAQIELGASVAWSGTVKLDGAVTAAGSPAMGTMVTYTSSPTSSLQVLQPLAVRAGGRYVGERVVAELDGDLWIAPAGAESTTWSIGGVRVVDSSQVAVDLRRIPSRISEKTHVALRTAVDVELIPGFLWATGGYAFSTLGTPAERLSPAFCDLGGHTLGLGLETTAGGVTVTLGWSRTWSPALEAATVLQLDNPFAAGDGPVLSGTYGGSLDQIGILIEAELSSGDAVP